MNRMTRLPFFFLIFTFLSFSSSLLYSMEGESFDAQSAMADSYSLFTGNFWFMGVDGSAKLNGDQGNYESSLGDRFSPVINALSARYEKQFGRAGYNVDFLWASRWDETTSENFRTAELNTNLMVFDITGDLRVFGTSEDGSGDSKVKFDLLGGGRVYFNNTDLEITPGSHYDLGRNYVDPVVGARLFWSLTPSLLLEARGDAGGFGVGSASELSSNCVTAFSWFFDEGIALTGGYRAFLVKNNFEKDGATAEVNTLLNGPYLGISFLLQ